MQTSLRGIARKAKQDRKYRFGNLYGMLNKQALYLAWHEINKNAVAGVRMPFFKGEIKAVRIFLT